MESDSKSEVPLDLVRCLIVLGRNSKYCRAVMKKSKDFSLRLLNSCITKSVFVRFACGTLLSTLLFDIESEEARAMLDLEDSEFVVVPNSVKASFIPFGALQIVSRENIIFSVPATILLDFCKCKI